MLVAAGCSGALTNRVPPVPGPELIVLGTAQDAGVPQAGSFAHPGWLDGSRRRLVTCLALHDPRTGDAWLFEATPDFRRQLFDLYRATGAPDDGVPTGIFLTHAHIGHYTGLMFLGFESMGTEGVPVYALARMRGFLETNGPWSQLVRLGNIDLHTLEPGRAVSLADDLRVEVFLVPHRQEFSEVGAYRIVGPGRSVLFIPDIDSWADLDATGVRIEDLIAGVDRAYIDGTFFDDNEVPGRDMSGFPHPRISASIERFRALPAGERAKIRLINPNLVERDRASPIERRERLGGMLNYYRRRAA